MYIKKASKIFLIVMVIWTFKFFALFFYADGSTSGFDRL